MNCRQLQSVLGQVKAFKVDKLQCKVNQPWTVLRDEWQRLTKLGYWAIECCETREVRVSYDAFCNFDFPQYERVQVLTLPKPIPPINEALQDTCKILRDSYGIHFNCGLDASSAILQATLDSLINLGHANEMMLKLVACELEGAKELASTIEPVTPSNSPVTNFWLGAWSLITQARVILLDAMEKACDHVYDALESHMALEKAGEIYYHCKLLCDFTYFNFKVGNKHKWSLIETSKASYWTRIYQVNWWFNTPKNRLERVMNDFYTLENLKAIILCLNP